MGRPRSRAPRTIARATVFAGLTAAGVADGAPGRAPPLVAAEDVARRATPAVRVFADKDGLPQNTVAAEAFDTEGRLWVGTQEGLAVYDGRAFQRVAFPEGAKSEWVTAIAELPRGAMAIGTHADGVWVIDGDGRFTHADASSGLPDSAVLCVAAADDGSELWVGTRHGLARHVGAGIGGAWSVVSPKEVPFVAGAVASVALSPGPSPTAWVGTELGVAVFSAATWRTYAAGENGLPNAHVSYIALEAEGGGRVRPWVSTRGGGLATLDGNRWHVLRAADGLPCDDIGPVVPLRGALWIGTICGGLARRDHERVTVIDARSSPLQSDLVRSLLVGRPSQGPPALWVGTETGGVARVSLGGWRSLTAKDSPLRSAVYAFGWTRADGSPADDGTSGLVTWIGTESGLERYDGSEWSEVKLPGVAASDAYVNAVFSARGAADRGLWVGTFGGAGRLLGGKWTVYGTTEGLLSKTVLTFREATGERGEPELLAGMRNGLARFDGQRWIPVTGTGAPTAEEVSSIVETGGPAGRPVLWVATVGAGLFRREGDAWTRFVTGSSPLPCNEVLQVQRALLPGGRERLFVSTGEAGLAWLDPAAASPRWSLLSAKTTPALPDQVVYGVQQDTAGRLYAFTNHGVARMVLRAGEPEAFDIAVLTTEDGLPSNECNSGGSGVDPLGRIWAGTVSGAAVLDPKDETEDHEPKRLRLASSRLFEEPFDLSRHPELSHDEDTLSFELSLLSFHRATDSRFRTQLVGLERQPSAWTPDSKVRYTSLPAGAYELRAWGRDYAGNESGPLVIPFRVRPAPWRTWWAFALYAGAAASLVVLGTRARVASLKTRAQELSDRVALRTAELATRNAELATKNLALDRKNAELVASHERADRIFAAFTDVLPGSVLDDKYRIEERIGAGGFATVFRARQLSLDRAVAVKIFRPSPGNDSAMALERFRREGMSACRVHHPNAIQVYDAAISTDGIPYIVMELLEGRPLSTEIRRSGGLTLRRALGIAIPVCEALAAAHEAGLIHRDIKPDNVFLHHPAGADHAALRAGVPSDTEIVKLLDFGIAKLLEAEDPNSPARTASEAFIGTPRYMAPERLSYSNAGKESDVYSVGVLLYEMVLGRAPWPATKDLFSLIAQILAGRVMPLKELGVPERLSDVVMRALSPDPAARLTAADLARELAAVRGALAREELDAVYGVPEARPDEVTMTGDMTGVEASGVRREGVAAADTLPAHSRVKPRSG